MTFAFLKRPIAGKVQKISFIAPDGDTLLATVSPAKLEFVWKNIPSGPRAIYIEYTLANNQRRLESRADYYLR